MSKSFLFRDTVLITPNKCGSVTAESFAKVHQMWVPTLINKIRLAQQRNQPLTVYCTTRNPVDYFVSGYRFLKRQPAHTPGCHRWSFEQHLEHALHTKHNPHQYTPDFFEEHAWWGPRRTLEVCHKYFGRVKWLHLEDKTVLPQFLISHFDILPHPNTDRNNTDKESPYITYPRLTERCVEIMRELDDWSEICGYNFKKSVKRYNKRFV